MVLNIAVPPLFFLQAALDEKFTEQNIGIEDLLKWVMETEEKLGAQQPMKEIPKHISEQLEVNRVSVAQLLRYFNSLLLN